LRYVAKLVWWYPTELRIQSQNFRLCRKLQALATAPPRVSKSLQVPLRKFKFSTLLTCRHGLGCLLPQLIHPRHLALHTRVRKAQEQRTARMAAVAILERIHHSQMPRSHHGTESVFTVTGSGLTVKPRYASFRSGSFCKTWSKWRTFLYRFIQSIWFFDPHQSSADGHCLPLTGWHGVVCSTWVPSKSCVCRMYHRRLGRFIIQDYSNYSTHCIFNSRRAGIVLDYPNHVSWLSRTIRNGFRRCSGPLS